MYKVFLRPANLIFNYYYHILDDQVGLASCSGEPSGQPRRLADLQTIRKEHTYKLKVKYFFGKNSYNILQKATKW